MNSNSCFEMDYIQQNALYIQALPQKTERKPGRSHARDVLCVVGSVVLIINFNTHAVELSSYTAIIVLLDAIEATDWHWKAVSLLSS